MAAVVFSPTRKDSSNPVVNTSSVGEGPGEMIVVKLMRHQLWRAVYRMYQNQLVPILLFLPTRSCKIPRTKNVHAGDEYLTVCFTFCMFVD